MAKNWKESVYGMSQIECVIFVIKLISTEVNKCVAFENK